MLCRSANLPHLNPKNLSPGWKQRRGPDVLPCLSNGDHRAPAIVCGRIPVRSLRAAFLLQLLVGFPVAGYCPFLDAGQLSPAFQCERVSANPLSLNGDRDAGDDLLVAARISSCVLPLV